MRRVPVILFGVLTPLVLALVLVSGCKKSGDEGEEGGGGGPVKKLPPPAMEGIAMGTGTIKGKVTLQGGDPDVEALTKKLQDAIKEKKDDTALCMMGSSEETTQYTYRIGTNHNVGNVFVMLLPPDKNSFFKFDEKEIDALKKANLFKEVERIDQPHCAFMPHCALAFPAYLDPKAPLKNDPISTGQKFYVVNSAETSHNTSWPNTGKIPRGNQLLTALKKGSDKPDMKELPLAPESAEPLVIECNIHGWMKAYIWSLPHPYAAITKSDTNPKETFVKPSDPAFGTYEIHNVPAGKLKIVAWHEGAAGGKFLTKDRTIATADPIEVKAGETVTKDFELEPAK
jgi:hypothetical protein